MWMPWRRRQIRDDPRPTTGALARDERLSAYLDGELPDGEVGAVERELALDPDMQSALEGLRQVRNGLQALDEVRAPRSFTVVASRAQRGRAVPWMERLPWAGRLARTGRAPRTTGMPWMELTTRVGAATAAVALLLVVAGDQLIGDSGGVQRSTPQFAQGEIESATLATADEAAVGEELAVPADTITQAAGAGTVADEPPGAAPAPADDDSATDPGAGESAAAGIAAGAAPAPADGSATDPGAGEAVEADSAPADSAGTEAGLPTVGETFAAPVQPESEDADVAEGPAEDARSAAPDAAVDTTEAAGAPSPPAGDATDDGEVELERALEPPPGTTPAEEVTVAPDAPPIEQPAAAGAASGTIEEQAGDSGTDTARIVELVLLAITAVLGAAAAGQWWLSRRRW